MNNPQIQLKVKDYNEKYVKYERNKRKCLRETPQFLVLNSLEYEQLKMNIAQPLIEQILNRDLSDEERKKLAQTIKQKRQRYRQAQKKKKNITDLGEHEDSSPSSKDQININNNNLQVIEEEELKEQNQGNNLSNHSQGADLPDDQTISEEPSYDVPPNEGRISNQDEMVPKNQASEQLPLDIAMIQPEPEIKVPSSKIDDVMTLQMIEVIEQVELTAGHEYYIGYGNIIKDTEIGKDLAKKVYNLILSIQGDKDMVHVIYEVPGKEQAITRKMALAIPQKNIIQAPREDKSDQLTYGQYTAGSLCALFKYLKAPTKLDPKEPLDQAYSMNQESLFLDIGSGFGYPCFLASLLCQCSSLGMEICPVRYDTSLQAKEKLEKQEDLNVQGWASMVSFEYKSATLDQDKPFLHLGEHVTHIYSYNYVQVQNDHFMKPIVKRLNLTDFRLLAWSVDEHNCKHYNLENVELVQKLSLTTHGANTTHMIYVYAKKLKQEMIQEAPQCQEPAQSQRDNSLQQQEQRKSLLMATPKTAETAEITLIGKRVVRDFSPKYEELKSTTNASVPSFSFNNSNNEVS